MGFRFVSFCFSVEWFIEMFVVFFFWIYAEFESKFLVIPFYLSVGYLQIKYPRERSINSSMLIIR